MAPVRGSLTVRPVDRSTSRSEAREAVGAAWRTRAMAPDTAGAAIDVPDFSPKVLPGSDDITFVPGAASATLDDASENDAMLPEASWAATAMALAAQAGKDTPAGS